MPFTLAHPVATLPVWWISRSRLPLSALCIGSMSPDFEYYFHMIPKGKFGHSLWGMLLFDLPVSLVALIIFHHLLKRPMLHLLPRRISYLGYVLDRPFAFFPVSRFILICTAILTGAFSHIAWDSATHEYGWLVRQWAALSADITLPGQITMSVYKFLQYSGGIIGLGLLAVAVGAWVLRQPRGHDYPVLDTRWRYAAIGWLAGASLALMTWNIYTVTGGVFTKSRLYLIIVVGVIGWMTGMLIALVVYGCVVSFTGNKLLTECPVETNDDYKRAIQ